MSQLAASCPFLCVFDKALYRIGTHDVLKNVRSLIHAIFFLKSDKKSWLLRDKRVQNGLHSKDFIDL